MKLPFTIIPGLNETAYAKWRRQFVVTGRKRHEGVWRRTQEPCTQRYSGYISDADARWKLVHFFDEYDLIEADGGYTLALQKPYLWMNTALPEQEIQDYYDKTIQAMRTGGWNITKRPNGLTATMNDLTAELNLMDRQKAEELAQRNLPENYKVLDIEIYGPSQHLSQEERERPWRILHGGIRKALTPGNPTIISSSDDDFDLSDFVPFHLELGCGPSVEAGVPPLSHLHKTYAISNPKTHNFLIGEQDDLPVRFFSDPERFYIDASLIYASAMKAKPETLFYQEVKRLYDQGQILGPVFTNNYDGLTADLGLPERYLRKFDDSHVFPEVDFDERAKALVVVGSHADRRKL